MASNHTSNYNLCQWEATDAVLRTDFNEDNAKVDNILGNLTKQVTENTDTIAQHTDLIAKLGNCELFTFHYVGNGKYGPSNRNSITFPKVPLLIFIFSSNMYWVGHTDSSFCAAFSNTGNVYINYCTRIDNTVYWHSEQNADAQMNGAAHYRMVALLDAGT